MILLLKYVYSNNIYLFRIEVKEMKVMFEKL